MDQLLDGLKVLELGCGSTAASMAGMLMADAGARVIKIEPPEGDPFRRSYESAFLVWNRGKESLVLDLPTRAGQDRYHEFAAGADVVLDGLTLHRAQGWGLGSDALLQVNPALIYCAFSGFGPDGDYSDIKAYESIVAAKSGFLSRGAYSFRPGPTYYPVPWGGFGAALQGVSGVLAALRVRDRCGRGQRLDASLFAGLDATDLYGSAAWQLAVRRGEGKPKDVLGVTGASRFGMTMCSRDGRFILVPTMMQHQAQSLARVAGLAYLLEMEQFAGAPQFPTVEDAQAWEDALSEAFRAQDADHWQRALAENGNVPFEVMITSEEGLAHPQIRHNGDAITIVDPRNGPIRQVGPLGHYAETPCVIDRPAPRLDQHDSLWETVPRPTAAAGDVPEFPLSGVTIVEFGSFYAMPYALTVLGSMGARVIKLEDAAGDTARKSFGPEVLTSKTTPSKESLSINLRDPGAQEFVRRILASADAFVVGFRPGVAERVGLGYDDLKKINPKLIFVQATGYGADGPMGDRPLYGPCASAVGGAYGRQVGYWSDPARNEGMSVLEIQAIITPRLHIIPDGDPNGSLGLLGALSLALHHQRTSGKGQFLLTSMIASNAWAYSDDFSSYDGKVPVPRADEEYMGIDALHHVYETSQGWVCLHVDHERDWQALAAAVDLDTTPFATREQRAAADADLAAQLASAFGTRSAADWEKQLRPLGVACVEAFEGGQPEFICTDPVLRATGRTVEVTHPTLGPMVRLGAPVAFGLHPDPKRPCCLRGEHNRALAEEFGEPGTFERLTVSGVLFPPDPVPPA